MGKDNRQRRAARQRKRAARERTTRSAGRAGPRDSGPDLTEDELVGAAAFALIQGQLTAAAEMTDELAQRDRADTSSALHRRLEAHLVELWDAGWQPADVDRLASKELGSAAVDALRVVVGAEARRYRGLGERVAPEWMAQVDALAPDAPRLARLDGEWRAIVAATLEALALVWSLPELPILAPPPSQWREGMGGPATASVPDDVLSKVRALLNKAESTEFEAEADALTTKAQQLMTRHRIDRITLDASRPDGGPEQPVGRRFGIDDPYADAKAILLAVVAGANGCRSVWAKRLGFATVMGFPADLAVTEELFTSLLVQATAAMRREGSKTDGVGRSRTTRFRRSFLTSYAHRIGDRLEAAAGETVREADVERGGALVPMLAARDHRVDEATDRAFPTTGTFSPRISDAEGWHAGRLHADQADLSLGAQVEQRSRR